MFYRNSGRVSSPFLNFWFFPVSREKPAFREEESSGANELSASSPSSRKACFPRKGGAAERTSFRPWPEASDTELATTRERSFSPSWENRNQKSTHKRRGFRFPLSYGSFPLKRQSRSQRAPALNTPAGMETKVYCGKGEPGVL